MLKNLVLHKKYKQSVYKYITIEKMLVNTENQQLHT